MTSKQQIFAILVSLAVFVLTIDMVRKKRLREEYSLLWLGTSVMMLTLIIRYDWLLALTKLIGAVLPTTTLFLGSILFLVLLSVQFSMKISKLSNQVKDLVQENALLRYEFEKFRNHPDQSAEQETGKEER
ncbi:MAG: DUF2304 domain-containing protein [Deltaproteobacteria bacterium HGW-Deltaproteobacteria-23]|jgi:hypothetical protein|nr:MAG: DUF2304 domain-containing protein [Deltaproteobacteria bacterium HGW-Deltaproteobacteria-23]